MFVSLLSVFVYSLVCGTAFIGEKDICCMGRPHARFDEQGETRCCGGMICTMLETFISII